MRNRTKRRLQRWERYNRTHGFRRRCLRREERLRQECQTLEWGLWGIWGEDYYARFLGADRRKLFRLIEDNNSRVHRYVPFGRFATKRGEREWLEALG